MRSCGNGGSQSGAVQATGDVPGRALWDEDGGPCRTIAGSNEPNPLGSRLVGKESNWEPEREWETLGIPAFGRLRQRAIRPIYSCEPCCGSHPWRLRLGELADCRRFLGGESVVLERATRRTGDSAFVRFEGRGVGRGEWTGSELESGTESLSDHGRAQTERGGDEASSRPSTSRGVSTTGRVCDFRAQARGGNPLGESFFPYFRAATPMPRRIAFFGPYAYAYSGTRHAPALNFLPPWMPCGPDRSDGSVLQYRLQEPLRGWGGQYGAAQRR